MSLSNDDVYVYGSANAERLLIRHPLQRNITCLAWKPKTEDTLAVGCQAAIVIWTFQANQPTSRVPIGCARLIQHVPTPITSIAYDITGEWLATCSPTAWNITVLSENKNKEHISVRHWLSGVSRLNWSPDGIRLAVHTTTSKVRIFESKAWSSASWGSDAITSRCQASCWSRPSGRFLLFATSGCPTLFAVMFLDRADADVVGGQSSVIHALDLDALEQPANAKEHVGGPVHDMHWDRHAERLVISFRGSCANNTLAYNSNKSKAFR